MNTPVINIFRSKTEAFYFKNSQQNRFYAFTGVQLLPNNPLKYIQVTDTPNGLNLEDWTVKVVNMCTDEKTDITPYFTVEKLTNSLNGNPQLYWSLENVPFDFGYELIYLEITQAIGETFYSQPFLLTEIDSDKTTQFHYKTKKSEPYQSIGVQTWFRNITRNEELTQYYEASTRNTVTQAVKVNKLEKHFTELMSLDILNHISDILICPYLYLNKIRISLFEAPKFPEVTNQENFGKMEFIVSPNKYDVIDLDSLFPVIIENTLLANPDTFNLLNSGATNLYVLANDNIGTAPTTITSVIQTGLTTGVVTISVDGQHLIFTPNGTNTNETFSYTITDSLGLTSKANVALNVSAIAPSLTAVNETVNLFNSGAQNIYPLSNDSLGILPTNITSLDTSLITTGAITISLDGQYLVFSPNGNYADSETFTYTITDSTSATSTATITLSTELPTTDYYYEGRWTADDETHPNGGTITYIDQFNNTIVEDYMYLGGCMLIKASSIISAIGVKFCTL
jgi:hypothetical protein